MTVAATLTSSMPVRKTPSRPSGSRACAARCSACGAISGLRAASLPRARRPPGTASARCGAVSGLRAASPGPPATQGVRARTRSARQSPASTALLLGRICRLYRSHAAPCPRAPCAPRASAARRRAGVAGRVSGRSCSRSRLAIGSTSRVTSGGRWARPSRAPRRRGDSTVATGDTKLSSDQQRVAQRGRGVVEPAPIAVERGQGAPETVGAGLVQLGCDVLQQPVEPRSRTMRSDAPLQRSCRALPAAAPVFLRPDSPWVG